MSRPAFFNSGRTWARLKRDGNVPVWNDMFASLAMTGANTAEDAFRSGHTIRYDTIGEFNVDWKAEYSALSSTRSQKKKLKQPTPVPL